MYKRSAVLVALVASLLLGYGVAQAVVIPIGVDTTLFSMDYHATDVRRDPNHPGFPIPAITTVTSEANRAHGSISAAPGEAGVVRASVGITVEWDLGGQEWEAVKDLPVEVTLNFSYMLVSNWSNPNGSANAGIGVRSLQTGWYDFLGFESGETGARSGQEAVSFTTTPEQIGQRIYLEAYAQAHTSPTRLPNDAQVTVTLNSIRFDFNPLPSDLVADGLEVTQAVQDLNNSVRLVAGKRTFVRFHVSTTAPDQSHRTYAQLRLTRPGNVQLLAPINTGYHVTVRNDPIRGVLHHAFLFELPGEFTRAGDLSLTAELNPITNWRVRAPVETSYDNNTVNRTVAFEAAPALNLVIYGVGYRANNQLWYPTGADVEHLVSWLRRAYPVSGVNLWRRSYFHGDALPDPGVVNTQLLAKKRWDRAYDRGSISGRPPVGAHFYGMVHDGGGFMQGMAAEIPGSTVAGPTGVRDGFVWDTDGSYGDWYGGHELGHSYARRHPGHCDQERDGAHPAGDHPFGRISPTFAGNSALYGFDIQTKQIYGPAWSDVMTYCDFQWVSDFTYEGLLTYFQSTPVSVATDNPSAQTGDYLLVTGVIDPETNQTTLSPAFLIPDITADSVPTPGPYSIVLHTASGAQLAAYPFTPLSAGSGRPDPRQPGTAELHLLLISEFVPFVPGTELVTIDHTSGRLASLQPGANPPLVTLTVPNGGETLAGDEVTVTWTASDADNDPLFFNVQYSPDGLSWEMLAQTVSGNSVTISNTDLIAGEAARFRVWATDRLHTSSDASDASFRVPNHPPLVAILEPSEMTTAVVSQTIGFIGDVSDSDALLADSQIEWRSDRDGVLGSGPQLSTALLSTGAHTITLAVDDGSSIVTDTVTVIVLADPILSPALPNALLVAPSPLILLPAQAITQARLAVDNQNTVQSIPWQASTDQPWLTLDVTTGVTPGDITVSYNDTGLAGGVYTGTVTVTSTALPGESATAIVQLVLPGEAVLNGVYLPLILR